MKKMKKSIETDVLMSWLYSTPLRGACSYRSPNSICAAIVLPWRRFLMVAPSICFAIDNNRSVVKRVDFRAARSISEASTNLIPKANNIKKNIKSSNHQIIKYTWSIRCWISNTPYFSFSHETETVINSGNAVFVAAVPLTPWVQLWSVWTRHGNTFHKK